MVLDPRLNGPSHKGGNPIYANSSLAFAHDELGLVDNGGGNVDFLNNAPSTKGDSQYDYLSANIVGAGSLSIGSQNGVPTLKANGNAGYDQSDSATLTNGSDNSHTIITVVKISTLGSTTRRIFSMQESPARPQILTFANDLFYFPGGSVQVDASKVLGDWIIVVGRSDDMAGDYDMQIYGVDSATGSGSINPIGVSQLFNSQDDGYSPNVEMACKYAFTEYLSDEKIEEYCGFLANKYNTVRPIKSYFDSQLTASPSLLYNENSWVDQGSNLYHATNLGTSGSTYDLNSSVLRSGASDHGMSLASVNGRNALRFTGDGGLKTGSALSSVSGAFTVFSVTTKRNPFTNYEAIWSNRNDWPNGFWYISSSAPYSGGTTLDNQLSGASVDETVQGVLRDNGSILFKLSGYGEGTAGASSSVDLLSMGYRGSADDFFVDSDISCLAAWHSVALTDLDIALLETFNTTAYGAT